jgi:site-specific DNA-methyltransferase (adenine-specific)
MNLIYNIENIKLYCGDCREVMPKLQTRFSAIITDPIWPNVPAGMFNITESPYQILKEAADIFSGMSDRVIIQLGCDSDPRFLNSMPESLPFFRHLFMEYLIPNAANRLLEYEESNPINFNQTAA